MYGKETVVSVGDRGTFKVATGTDLTGTGSKYVYIYTETAWEDGDPPTKELVATASNPEDGILEADMAADTFTIAGKHYLRSGVTFANGEVLGAPAEVMVTRGKGTV